MAVACQIVIAGKILMNLLIHWQVVCNVIGVISGRRRRSSQMHVNVGANARAESLPTHDTAGSSGVICSSFEVHNRKNAAL